MTTSQMNPSFGNLEPRLPWHFRLELNHRLWTPNEAFFHRNPKFLCLGRQFELINFGAFGGIFGRFIRTHFGTVSRLSMFSINQPLLLLKTEPLYPNPKYLFGIGIWIWDLAIVCQYLVRELNILKGNCCILWIDLMPKCVKIGLF